MQENHEPRKLKADFYGSNTVFSHLKHSATNQATWCGNGTQHTQHIQAHVSPASSVIKQDFLIKIMYLYWAFLLITACKQNEANI